MTIAAGARIDHYEIISLLGKGGMGEVYLAEDTRLSRKVALKLLPAEFTQDTDRLRRFEQEARAASALNHPNIITIYEIGQVEAAHFIAAEFIEGQTLRERMSNAPMKLPVTLETAVQVASALAAAHAAGIVHRDIKPENIMLRPDGYVKVLDFGLAKLAESPSSSKGDASQTATVVTKIGMVVGTAQYMSPEQARGIEVDARTDVFSLGVVLYEMIAGRTPFAGHSPAEVIAAILEHEPPPLARFAREVPEALEWIVTKALAKDPEERYQTVKDLALDLKSLKQRLELQAELKRSRSSLTGSPGSASEIRRTTVSGAQNSQAPVEAAALPQTVSSAEYLIEGIQRHKRAAAVAVAALIVALIAITYGPSLIRERSEPVQPPVQRALSRLTFDAGLQSEPSWSPDSRFIAYSTDRSGNFDIWVQPAGEGNPVQVTHSPAHDWQPDVSPDGRLTAFRSERDGGGLFVVPFTGGGERKVSAFGYYPRWSPDGSQILFLSSGDHIGLIPKVYLVGLDGSPPREVLAEFLRGAGYTQFGFRHLAWHPDGKRISIWAQHNTSGLGLWTVPFAGGDAVKSQLAPEVEQQLKAAAVTPDSLEWAPSGRTLYVEGTAQGVKNLWRVTVDPKTLRWIAGPERLTTGAGRDTDIAISRDGKKLTFTTRLESSRIWSVPFDAATGQLKGAGEPVTPAGVSSLVFDLTRDGKKLAYFAGRPGKQELWEKSLEDGNEKLLVPADNAVRSYPVWSRDGTRLAYRRIRTIKPGETDTSIVVLPAGGDEQVITSQGQRDGPKSWSADGKWILSLTTRPSSERWRIWLVPLAAAPHAETQARVVAADPDYNFYQPQFSPDERWIVFMAVKASEVTVSTICVMLAAGGEWTRLTDGKYLDDKPRWSPDGKVIYFTSPRGGFTNVWGIRIDPANAKALGEPFRVTKFESPNKLVAPGTISSEIAVTANLLALPIMEVSGSIWILEDVDR